MPTLTEKITIASPLSEVWPLLSDPEAVAACLPGASLASDQEDGLWKGTIKVKFGPTVVVFRGEARLSYDHTAHTCTIEGRGIDQRGASRALANGLVTAAGTDTTELTVEGEYSVTGPLETFANAGGVHVARALLGEFATNMSNLVAETGGDSTPQTDADTVSDGAQPSPVGSADAPRNSPNAQAAELNAFALLWAAFKSWLNSLFGKRT
jgi:carbon monoxide dehydrogenase subunit G